MAQEKEAGSVFSRWINSMIPKNKIDWILKDQKGYMDEQIYLDYLVLIIAQVADEGDVVILGRGSQYILRDHPEAHHVLLIDNVENRVRFMMDNYNLAEKKARQMVADEDKRRLSLYRRLGKADYDSPFLYDVTLNMGRLSMEEAKKQVLCLIGA
jgi:cytidylate kinase